MSDSFVAFILTHGRPGNVKTYKSLRRSGYTGRIVVLVDDEDQCLAKYRTEFGTELEVFSKTEVARSVDEGNNFGHTGSVLYARRATFDVAKRLGVKHFIQLDDDYLDYNYRWWVDRVYNFVPIRDPNGLDNLFKAMVDFLECSPHIVSVAMSQPGDHIGGGGGDGRYRDISAKRKAMNAWVFATDRLVNFIGTQNDDVNTYVMGTIRGQLFLTHAMPTIDPMTTQSQPGGLTEMYLRFGTHVKSFHTVMMAPSSVKVSVLSDPRSPHPRFHHFIDWSKTAPCILRESHRRSS